MGSVTIGQQKRDEFAIVDVQDGRTILTVGLASVDQEAIDISRQIIDALGVDSPFWLVDNVTTSIRQLSGIMEVRTNATD